MASPSSCRAPRSRCRAEEERGETVAADELPAGAHGGVWRGARSRSRPVALVRQHRRRTTGQSRLLASTTFPGRQVPRGCSSSRSGSADPSSSLTANAPCPAGVRGRAPQHLVVTVDPQGERVEIPQPGRFASLAPRGAGPNDCVVDDAVEEMKALRTHDGFGHGAEDCRFAGSWGQPGDIFAGSWGQPFRSMKGPPAREP
jgi:hypothetical protein